jgi:hypothetical protein
MTDDDHHEHTRWIGVKWSDEASVSPSIRRKIELSLQLYLSEVPMPNSLCTCGVVQIQAGSRQTGSGA